MYRLLTIFMMAQMLICSCSKNDISESGKDVTTTEGQTTITFYVSNYRQMPYDETRASQESNLPHLAFAIQNVSTGEMAVPLCIQDNGSEGYGTFQATLDKGNYRIVCIGYDKDYAASISAQGTVSFEQDYVPMTFLCSEQFSVNNETPTLKKIVLKRIISSFYITMLDMIPSNLAKIRIKSEGGGTAFDVSTGFTTQLNKRDYCIAIPSELTGSEGLTLSSHLFLPDLEATATYCIEALDAEDNVIGSKTFLNVPLKRNTITEYTGNFFSGSAIIEGKEEIGFNALVDYEWGKTISGTY